MSDDATDERLAGLDEGDDAIQAMVARMRANIVQRRAEVAALGTCQLSGSLSPDAVEAELAPLVHLVEPPCVSQKPLIGRLLVWLRLKTKKAFFAWYAEPLLNQQSEFNSKVARLSHELAREFDTLYTRLDAIERKLARLSK